MAPPTHAPAATLFISKLPGDCGDDELARLFEDFPGFVSASVVPGKMSGTSIGFVTFKSIDDATMAHDDSQFMEFPTGNRLNIEYSTKGTKRDDKDGRNGKDGGSSRRRRDDTPPRKRDSGRDKIDPKAMGPYEKTFRSWERDHRASGDDNEPKTVFVKGIPGDCQEREAMHLFRPFPGFKNLRLVPMRETGGMIAFAEFSTGTIAKFVVHVLDGYDFAGDGKRLLVEIAKNKGRSDRDRDRNRDKDGDRERDWDRNERRGDRDTRDRRDDRRH